MADLKAAYRALDPAKHAEWEVYVPRPGDAMGVLRAEFDFRESPLRVLLGGQRGVGKTTELRRLRGDEGGGLYHPSTTEWTSIWFMAPDLAGISVGAMMASVVHQLRHEGYVKKSPSDPIRLSPLSGLRPAPPAERISPEEFTRFLQQDLNTKQPPLLLLDGLERVTPSDAEAFVIALRSVPAHVVLVVPIPFLLGAEYSSTVSEWERVLFLPAISVFRRDGSPNYDGVELMASILNRRVGGDVFQRYAQRMLISASAGIHRELLMLAQQACMRASLAGLDVVTPEIAHATINDKRHEYSFHLTPLDIEYLKTVAAHQRISGDPRALSLLNRNLIVSYQDDSAWYDVHAIVKPLLKSPGDEET